MRIVIQRAASGRRCGRKRRCFVTAGTIACPRLPAGPSTVRFTGRLGGRRLPSGRYRATVTATDLAGNRSAPARATFAIATRAI